MTTEINYRTQVAAQAEQHAAEQKTAENDAAWNEIINTYAIRDHKANRQMVTDYSNGTLSLAAFKYLVAHPPKGFQLDWSNEKTLKTELINAIFERSSRNGAVPEFSKPAMAGWSLRQLRNRLDEIVRREYLNQFPADALKAAVVEQRTQEDKSRFYFDRNGMRWPRLTSVTVPPGHVSAMSTAEFLRQSVKAGFAPALRHYVSKYGQEQVNNFLNS